jgi:cyclophilin family peptidyl-prolyl cis-trans isomerase
MSLAQGQKDTGCSEFIICLEPNRDRDPKVIDKNNPSDGAGTVFGRVVAGLDVLSKVRENVATRPLSQGVDKIIKARRLNKLEQKYEVKKIDEKAKSEEAKKTEPGTKDAGTKKKDDATKAGEKSK